MTPKRLPIVNIQVLAKNAFRMGNPSNVVPLVAVVKPQWLSDPEYRKTILAARGRAPALDNKLDGYRFGSANAEIGKHSSGKSEAQLLEEFEQAMKTPVRSWSELDRRAWGMVQAWDATHRGLTASRCCAFVVINRSEGALQIANIQMVHGRNVTFLGSAGMCSCENVYLERAVSL